MLRIAMPRCTFPILTLSLGALSAPAATLTAVQPPYPGEASHAEIFGAVLGGTFTAIGDDFTNGVLSAVRVDDDQDQIWSEDTYDVQAVARYAYFEQSFGYLDESGDYTNLFDVVGTGTSVTGNATTPSLTGPVRLARNGTDGTLASTLPSDNPLGLDHAVTYRITPANTNGPATILEQGDTAQYLVFFEDINAATGSPDFDHNDLVVSVTASSDVPEPGAMALLGLGCMMMLGRSRRG